MRNIFTQKNCMHCIALHLAVVYFEHINSLKQKET